MTTQEERLEALAAECAKELTAIGIRPPEGIAFRVNTRAKARLGLCRKTAAGIEIEIASQLLVDADDRSVKETLHHELLHTLPGCMNHQRAWKAYAAAVNTAYGYEIQRLAGDGPRQAASPKFCVTCRSCGMEYLRRRKSSVVTHPARYRCSRCGGRLKVETIKEGDE